MLVKTGTVTRGYYINDEWVERMYPIEAHGETEDKLRESIDKLTIKHTVGGNINNSGNSTETEHVLWEDEVYEKTPIDYRSEVFEFSVMIPRSHEISIQYDSSISGKKKWIAAHKNTIGYGSSKTDAISKVTDQLRGVSIWAL